MTNENFRMVYDDVWRAKQYIGIDGATKKLTWNHKAVYTYMSGRFNHFNGIYHEKQQDIADGCGISLRVCKDVIHDFIESGVYVVEYGFGNRTKYKAINKLSVVHVRKKEAKQKKLVDKPKQVVYDPMYEDWDDDPPPF